MKEGRENNVRVTSEREEGKKTDGQTDRQTGGGGDEKDKGAVLGGMMEGKLRQLSLYIKGIKRWVYRIGLTSGDDRRHYLSNIKN